MSLMPTTALSEFRLSVFESASKLRAPESPAFSGRAGPANSLGLSWVPSAPQCPYGPHLHPRGSPGSLIVAGGRAGATERCSLGVSGDAFTMSWTEREGPSVSTPTRRAQSTASDFRSVKKRAAQPSGGHRLCLGSSGGPTECKECL
jgi:hypothetical protein